MRLVLNYHSIDDSDSVVSTSRDVFESQMRWLSTSRFRVVPIESIRESSTDDLVAITFDDGYRNFAEHALPVLATLNLPSTVFVVTSLVGFDNSWDRTTEGIPLMPLMDWGMLERCLTSGARVGGHTRTHRRLSGISAAELEDETHGCAEDILSRLGTPAKAFAYPFGSSNRFAREAAGRSFDVSCTTDLRLVTASEDRNAIPRVDAFYFRRRGNIEQIDRMDFPARVRLRNAARYVRRWSSAER